MFNLSATQTQAFASILAGADVDALLAEQTVTDLVAKHEASKYPARASYDALQAHEAHVDATPSKYDGMTDAELRAELCVRTFAFVSPNMTTEQIRTKLAALDTEVVVATKTKPNAPKTQRLGVGKRQVELLKEGKTVDETLAIIQEEFPTAKTSKACVAWYKSKIKAGLY